MAEHKADYRVRRLATKNPLTALCGRLSGAKSLREIVGGWTHALRLYHVGGRSVSCSTLADANARRFSELFSGLLAVLVSHARRGLRRKVGEATSLTDATSVRLSALSRHWPQFCARTCGAKSTWSTTPRPAGQPTPWPQSPRSTISPSPPRFPAPQPSQSRPDRGQRPARIRTPRARQPYAPAPYRLPQKQQHPPNPHTQPGVYPMAFKLNPTAVGLFRGSRADAQAFGPGSRLALAPLAWPGMQPEMWIETCAYTCVSGP